MKMMKKCDYVKKLARVGLLADYDEVVAKASMQKNLNLKQTKGKEDEHTLSFLHVLFEQTGAVFVDWRLSHLVLQSTR